ncbi:MAG TPA: Gfo/Idh/MocA family oxidoreductase [Acidimicrobiia bacterium]|jgi:predicted dehydrogenase
MTHAPVTGAVVIGCGLVGQKRAVALEELSVPVVGLVDTDDARAAELAAALRDAPPIFTDVSSACAADGAELAIVATTHDGLAGSAIAALDAGCHVLIEKPGACDHVQLTEVTEAARRSERVVRIGYNHRFHPAVLEARRLVTSGSFGPLMSLRARYGHGGRLGYESEWRADASRGGGELLDQGSHLVDLVRFFAGDVELEFAELRTDFWDMEVEDNAYLALRIRDGGFAWLHASWTEWKNLFAVEIAMRDARLDVIGLGGSYGPERLVVHAMRPELGPPDTTEQVYDCPDRSWAAELEDVLGEIAGRPSLGARLDDGLAVLTVVDQARRP